jgi:hypothetical protein
MRGSAVVAKIALPVKTANTVSIARKTEVLAPFARRNKSIHHKSHFYEKRTCACLRIIPAI